MNWIRANWEIIILLSSITTTLTVFLTFIISLLNIRRTRLENRKLWVEIQKLEKELIESRIIKPTTVAIEKLGKYKYLEEKLIPRMTDLFRKMEHLKELAHFEDCYASFFLPRPGISEREFSRT